MLRALTLLTLVLPLAACASRASNPYEGADGSIEIEVQNLNFADATLHALRGTERIRLGIVTGKTDRTFELEWKFSLPLRIHIDLLAGDSCTTRPLDVQPGDVILLQIESRLSADPDCF